MLMLGVDDEDVCFEKFAFKALLECLSAAVTNPVVTCHPWDRNCKHGLKMVLAALCFQLLIQGALDKGRSSPEVVDVAGSKQWAHSAKAESWRPLQGEFQALAIPADTAQAHKWDMLSALTVPAQSCRQVLPCWGTASMKAGHDHSRSWAAWNNHHHTGQAEQMPCERP